MNWSCVFIIHIKRLLFYVVFAGCLFCKKLCRSQELIKEIQGARKKLYELDGVPMSGEFGSQFVKHLLFRRLGRVGSNLQSSFL